jgi:hypothetical protein
MGDALDNALAETHIGLLKVELLRRWNLAWASTMSSSRRWSGSTGTATDDCTPPATT